MGTLIDITVLFILLYVLYELSWLNKITDELSRGFFLSRAEAAAEAGDYEHAEELLERAESYK